MGFARFAPRSRGRRCGSPARTRKSFPPSRLPVFSISCSITNETAAAKKRRVQVLAARAHALHDLGHGSARRESTLDGSAGRRAIWDESEDVLRFDFVGADAGQLDDAQDAHAVVAQPRYLDHHVVGAGQQLARRTDAQAGAGRGNLGGLAHQGSLDGRGVTQREHAVDSRRHHFGDRCRDLRRGQAGGKAHPGNTRLDLQGTPRLRGAAQPKVHGNVGRSGHAVTDPNRARIGLGTNQRGEQLLRRAIMPTHHQQVDATNQAMPKETWPWPARSRRAAPARRA